MKRLILVSRLLGLSALLLGSLIGSFILMSLIGFWLLMGLASPGGTNISSLAISLLILLGFLGLILF